VKERWCQSKRRSPWEGRLDIPKDGVTTDTDISITALSAEQLAALDAGLTNVTTPDSGYRFLPHGTRFKNKITVTLPYDPAMVPPGMTEQDITTYYFDETAGAWKPLEKVRVDTSQKVVESLSDHFTDMINATLAVPDHPQTVSFNPTSIKDIKAADPGAEVNLINARPTTWGMPVFPTRSKSRRVETAYSLRLPSSTTPPAATAGWGWAGTSRCSRLPSIPAGACRATIQFTTILPNPTWRPKPIFSTASS
jgi:hypothetical protein